MASFLSKFVRGAATAGAKLYADQASTQLRADITAKRDATLEANRAKREVSRREFEVGQTAQKQTFRAGEAATQREFRASESEKGRAATLATPQAQLAKLRLGEAETMSGLKKKYAAAKTDEERFTIVKQIRAAGGKPMEADRAASKSKGLSLIQYMIKTLKDEQYDSGIDPGDPDYRNPQELLDEADAMVQKVIGGRVPSAAPIINTTGHPSVSAQADYNELPSGKSTKYFNTRTGKIGTKP